MMTVMGLEGGTTRSTKHMMKAYMDTDGVDPRERRSSGSGHRCAFDKACRHGEDVWYGAGTQPVVLHACQLHKLIEKSSHGTFLLSLKHWRGKNSRCTCRMPWRPGVRAGGGGAFLINLGVLVP